MTTFFTADLHFDHAAIIKYCKRPFDSVEEMNEAIITRNNSIVKPDDILWILGDLGFCKTPDRLVELVSRMNGRKMVVLGNHDRERYFPIQNRDKMGIVELYWRMTERTDKEFGGFHPTLSHFPMISWNRSSHGSFNLHGHTHGTLLFNPNARQLDVGVDCHNFTPISWKQVVDKLGNIPTPKELSGGSRRGNL